MASEIITIGIKLSWIEEDEKRQAIFNLPFRSVLRRFKTRIPFEEGMLFRTPYHFEAIFVTETIDATIEATKELLRTLLPELEALPGEIFSVWERGEAIRHFFEAVLGVGTPLIGDVVFLESVKEGYTQSLESELTGPVLTRLFQKAVAIHRNLTKNTAFLTGAVTPEGAIRELGQQIFGASGKVAVAFLGNSPETQHLIAYFRQMNFGIRVTSGVTPEFFAGHPDEDEPSGRVDILIKTDQAPLSEAMRKSLENRLKMRRGIPLLFINLSENPVAPIKNDLFLCYSRADLEAVIRRNFREREKFVPAILKHLDKEVREFISWQYSRERFEFSGIIGRSRKLQQVLETIARVSATHVTVLIEGESGTGKELVARAIHRNSPRANKPFLVVNCAAISETLLESELFGYVKGAFTGATTQKKGLFEEADQGTIFLDEIAEMSPATQANILRVIQEGDVRRVGSTQTIRVDVRVLAATNKDLKKLVEEGKFREDLYYRLKVMHIVVPPLRERREDIPELAAYFVEKYSRKNGKHILGFTDDVLALLTLYPWPGNVRELENAMERAVIMTIGQHITPSDLPPEIQFFSEKLEADASHWPTIYDVEKEHILKTLDYVDWNLGRATELLGISRATLWRKLKEYGIQQRGSLGTPPHLSI